jgi:hypothetical protein
VTGVSVLWQLLESAVAPPNVQPVRLNWSFFLEENVTVPVGTLALAGSELSLTVAVQVVGAPSATEPGVQLSVVVVVRIVTATVLAPVLVWRVGVALSAGDGLIARADTPRARPERLDVT